ncbi:MAG: flagellar biosynthesis anti-sigma factor FlgM [Myxococcota bacterium]
MATPKLTLIDTQRDRASALKEAVRSGTYHVDCRALAVAILKSAEARTLLELERPQRVARPRSSSSL